MLGVICASKPDHSDSNLFAMCLRSLQQLCEHFENGLQLDMNNGFYVSKILAHLHREEPGNEVALQLELFFYQLLLAHRRS